MQDLRIANVQGIFCVDLQRGCKSVNTQAGFYQYLEYTVGEYLLHCISQNAYQHLLQRLLHNLL